MQSKYAISTTTSTTTAKHYADRIQAALDVKALGCGSVVPVGTGFGITFGKRGFLVRAIKRTNGHTIQ